MQDDIVRAGISGLTGGLASYTLLNEQGGTASFFGLQLPTSAVIGSSVAIASLLGDTLHDYVLPHISKNNKLNNFESSLLQIGVGGGGTAGILLYNGAPAQSIPNSFLLGAGSVVGGHYVTDRWILGKSNMLY